MNIYKTKQVGSSGDNSDSYLRLPDLNFGQDISSSETMASVFLSFKEQ
jgi:hypothetical protein